MAALAEVPRSPLDTLAVDIRAEVEAAEDDFVSAVQHAIRAGELLIEAKAQMKHGAWLEWLNSSGGPHLRPRPAQRYMAVARNASRVTHLETINAALDVLAAPKEQGPLRVAGNHPPGPPNLDPPAPLSHPYFKRVPENPCVKGAFTWFGPWVVECPDCGCDLYRNMRTD